MLNRLVLVICEPPLTPNSSMPTGIIDCQHWYSLRGHPNLSILQTRKLRPRLKLKENPDLPPLRWRGGERRRQGPWREGIRCPGVEGYYLLRTLGIACPTLGVSPWQWPSSLSQDLEWGAEPGALGFPSHRVHPFSTPLSHQQSRLWGSYLPVLGSSVSPVLLGGAHFPVGLQVPARVWQLLGWSQCLPSGSKQPVPHLETQTQTGNREGHLPKYFQPYHFASPLSTPRGTGLAWRPSVTLSFQTLSPVGHQFSGQMEMPNFQIQIHSSTLRWVYFVCL